MCVLLLLRNISFCYYYYWLGGLGSVIVEGTDVILAGPDSWPSAPGPVAFKDGAAEGLAGDNSLDMP